MLFIRSMLVAALSVAGVTAIAGACSCIAPPPPKEAMAASDAVFSGKCVNVEIEKDLTYVTFEVDRVWKGEIAPAVVISTPSNGGECGYSFTTKGDATYIIYANGKKGALQTNICTRTKPLSAAKVDLKDLGDGARPKPDKKEDKK